MLNLGPFLKQGNHQYKWQKKEKKTVALNSPQKVTCSAYALKQEESTSPGNMLILLRILTAQFLSPDDSESTRCIDLGTANRFWQNRWAANKAICRRRRVSRTWLSCAVFLLTRRYPGGLVCFVHGSFWQTECLAGGSTQYLFVEWKENLGGRQAWGGRYPGGGGGTCHLLHLSTLPTPHCQVTP